MLSHFQKKNKGYAARNLLRIEFVLRGEFLPIIDSGYPNTFLDAIPFS